MVEDLAEVADEGYVDLYVFVDFAGVDFDVDLFGVGGVAGEVAGDAVVEAHAEGEEEIGMLDGVVDPGLAVHAHHAEGERVGGGEGSEAEEGAGDGDLLALGEGDDLVAGAGFDDAVAGEDEGLFGVADEFDGVAASRRTRRGAWGAGGGRGGGGVEVEGRGGLLGVLGDVDEDGAGAAGAGDLEGFADVRRRCLRRG